MGSRGSLDRTQLVQSIRQQAWARRRSKLNKRTWPRGVCATHCRIAEKGSATTVAMLQPTPPPHSSRLRGCPHQRRHLWWRCRWRVRNPHVCPAERLSTLHPAPRGETPPSGTRGQSQTPQALMQDLHRLSITQSFVEVQPFRFSRDYLQGGRRSGILTTLGQVSGWLAGVSACTSHRMVRSTGR